MKNPLFIHIGMHKTGTSYLQNRYYPYLTNTIYVKQLNQIKRISTQGKEDFNYLISLEALSGIAWNGQWKLGIPNDWHWITSFEDSMQHLKALHPHAHIFIVFRKHGDILVSMYKQYIQEGGVLGLDRFYGPDKIIRPDDMSYRHRIDRLREEFEKVDFISYEDFRKGGNDFFDSYMKSLGIERGELPEIKKRANESISGAKLPLLRNVNKVFNKLPSRLQRTIIKLGVRPGVLVQHGLRFWKTQEGDDLKKLRTDVNAAFEEDWAYVEEHKWRP